MEAAEKTLTYNHDTGLHRKLLTPLKGKVEKRATDVNSDESNYVDLDVRPGGPATLRVAFTGDASQVPLIRCAKVGGEEAAADGTFGEGTGELRDCAPGSLSLLDTRTKLSDTESEHDAGQEATERAESEDLRYTDMYLSSNTEGEDSSSVVLPEPAEDESHYITTHEIQLTELDHDVDYDLGRGTRWEFEDDNLVYSFVDYASFESAGTRQGRVIVEGRGQLALAEAVSTEREDSDLCESEKCASSDESVYKNHSEDDNAAEIRLSIKACPGTVLDDRTQRFGDGNHFSLINPSARGGPLCDRGQYFIPAPGRQHFATKLRRGDLNDYSSGASSSFSELDDADKEVRNLTAKSFRSLACPYFDAINLSTSSESSVSEYGLNKWSAYVDWKYGKLRGGERSVFAHQASRSTVEIKNTADLRGRGNSIVGIRTPLTNVRALSSRGADSRLSGSSSQRIQLKDPQQLQRGVTLNFRCNVDSPDGRRSAKYSMKTRANVMTRSGCSADTHKRAIFASSLLKNVISKKMQLEQERKMERGEIHDTHPPVPPFYPLKDLDRCLGKSLHRQMSESGSVFTVNSSEGGCSCFPEEEAPADKTPEKGLDNLPENLSENSQNGVFNAVVGALEPAPTEQTSDSSSMLTKVLFVPGCQLIPKERDSKEETSHRTRVQEALIDDKQENSKEPQERTGNTPEIKICLRSVKEDRACPLNIAKLLTPKITTNLNTPRAVDDGKSHNSSGVEKVPSFTVRDVRDTKCKFQAPIYHVRDVRKLVKSSYRFISLDSVDAKYHYSSAGAAKEEQKIQTETDTNPQPPPIVIKCNSVKTCAKSQAVETKGLSKIAEGKTNSVQCSSGKVSAKSNLQLNLDQIDNQTISEAKVAKQRQDKFSCETAERRGDAAAPKQGALEKLKAAVKTMEQLYVFDKNEWKRKKQSPHLVAGNHLMPIIPREEQGVLDTQRTLATDKGTIHMDEQTSNVIQVPYSDNTFKTHSLQNEAFTDKSVLLVDGNSPVTQTLLISHANKNATAPAAPLLVKIDPVNRSQAEQGQSKISPNNPTITQGCVDSGNYLTIPGIGRAEKSNKVNWESVTRDRSLKVGCNDIEDSQGPDRKSSSSIQDSMAATIHHHSTVGAQKQQPQVLCVSPLATYASPTLSSEETTPQTQRKMLLDPTTGHYYLVDTPIHATTKKLYDPDTGQYVEVPMPHSPAASVTPVHLSLSPLALTPPAYAPTYMIYPGLMPSPTLAGQAVISKSPCHLEEAGGQKGKTQKDAWLEGMAAGVENAYYTSTGEAQRGILQLPVNVGHVIPGVGATDLERKPLISITAQQGPRIVAPPSFDGNTMSFVVEHR